MPSCKRVHYWGTMQGVGFRMMTKRIAGQFAVTGFVRNLPDGMVEVVVAGEPAEIDRFLGVGVIFVGGRSYAALLQKQSHWSASLRYKARK